MINNEKIVKVNTLRSEVFTFQVGVDCQQIQLLYHRVKDANTRFTSVPVLPEVAATLENEVIVSGIFGTDTIEGGTLTEEEVEATLISENVKEEKERRVLNLKQAYILAEEYSKIFFEDSRSYKDKGDPENQVRPVRLQKNIILDLHSTITDNLEHPHNVPGTYRDNQRGQITKVGDSTHGGVYRPPKIRQDIETLMKHYLEWINCPEVRQLDPLIRAPLAHYYFERIHPFWDGNGRVGRIIEAIILKCAGIQYAPFAMSRYYLEHIDEYFTVFNQARKAKERKEPYPNSVFVIFFLEGMLETLNRLHDRLNTMIGRLLYESSLNEKLQKKKINHRQLTIIQHLLYGSVDLDMLNKLQSQVWYSSLYRNLTSKTRARDLKGLEAEKLIEITADKKIRILYP